MPQVLAWECPRTHQLFKDIGAYKKHLRLYARDSLDAKKEAKRKAAKEKFFCDMRKNIRSVQQLEQFVKDNWEFFVRANMDRDPWRARQKKYKLPKLVYLKIELGPYKFCSNSHARPLTKTGNWGARDPMKPTGYMGWHGKFVWITDGDTPGFPSDIWEGTGVTNDGGGSSSSVSGRPLKKNENCYWGGITLWEDDWPGLSEIEMVRRLAPNVDPHEALI
jgi:hypothetical protein